MDKGKIIQIIPNNNNALYAYCESEDGMASKAPVVCFALVEYYNRHTDKAYRFIEPMFLSSDGEIEDIETYSEFKEIRGFDFNVYKVNEK
ncbi:hypothetical protein I9Y31_001433 [Clostridium perfringens]|nr:hypothetical protein [Clostridium perfringens]